MATLNLGRIKPVFRGAYNSATAYVVDDIVTSGGETFICILASTGNATSNATYWTKLAQKGTDGTDVGATLTTQGDVLYRDGSGLQRLAIGTAGQVLQVNSGATAPEYGTISSDFVKLATQELDSSGVSSFEFQNVFSSANDALYGGYHIQFYHQGTSNNGLDVRWLTGTNTELSGSTDYKFAGPEAYRQTNNANAAAGANADGDGRSFMPWDGWGTNGANDATEGQYYSGWIQGNMYGGTSQNRSMNLLTSVRDASSPNYIVGIMRGLRYEGTSNITGMKFYLASGNLHNGRCTLWGMKK